MLYKFVLHHLSDDRRRKGGQYDQK